VNKSVAEKLKDECPDIYPPGPLSCADCRFFRVKIYVTFPHREIYFHKCSAAFCAKGMFMDIDDKTGRVKIKTFPVHKKFWSNLNKEKKLNDWELANRCLFFDNMNEEVI